MRIDNRFRCAVCLLVTIVILCSGPFLWARPAVAAEASASAAASEQPQQPPEDEIVPEPSASRAPEPVVIKETLTSGQRYVEPLVAPGSTNLLICAPDPSAWNMDTIVIASISPNTGSVSLISLPRDVYIQYSASLEAAVEAVLPGLLDEPGMRKINAAHAIGDKLKYKEGTGRFDRPYIEFLADVIEEVFAIRVDDYVYLQTRGFRRIVDYFGGVTVNVPVRMLYNDPFQDLAIDLQPGSQHLDGSQAEGFVRFRQGYDDEGNFMNYGDVFRKENQSRFLKAFLQQHLTLRNLTRLSDISEFVSRNVITSVKGWDRIVVYGALAEKAVADKYPIEAVKLRMNDARIHGLSYVLIETEAQGSTGGSWEAPDTGDASGTGEASGAGEATGTGEATSTGGESGTGEASGAGN